MQPMGGTASLSLEDSEDPYLHGVKFSAMPPTKRYREMEQLSGGEKVRCLTPLSGFPKKLFIAVGPENILRTPDAHARVHILRESLLLGLSLSDLLQPCAESRLLAQALQRFFWSKLCQVRHPATLQAMNNCCMQPLHWLAESYQQPVLLQWSCDCLFDLLILASIYTHAASCRK